MSGQLRLEYYSDLLCVWAWIAERRNRELLEACGDQIVIDCHFLDLFSDTATRIGQGWADKGGYEAFSRHVRQAAEPYEDAPVHGDVWTRTRPKTSANAHLVLKAAQILEGTERARELATLLRGRFFSDAVDVGILGANLELAQEAGVDRDALGELIESGQAIAALLADSRRAHERRVVGSPTWIMNEGRQVLYGNVGYRVLHANVEELLKRPEHEASWC